MFLVKNNNVQSTNSVGCLICLVKNPPKRIITLYETFTMIPYQDRFTTFGDATNQLLFICKFCSSLNKVLHTCSLSFVSVTAFPSMSVGDMVTAPVAVASSDTRSCPSPLPTSGTSLASTLFLLEEREEEDPVILETVTRDDGLGDSFSLKKDTSHKQVQIAIVY